MAGWTDLPVEIKFKILSFHLTFTLRDLHIRRSSRDAYAAPGCRFTNFTWDAYTAPSCRFTSLIRVVPNLAPEAERLIKLENDKIIGYKTALEQIPTDNEWMELMDRYCGIRIGLNDVMFNIMKEVELEVPTSPIRGRIKTGVNLELQLLKECLIYVDFTERMNRLEGA